MLSVQEAREHILAHFHPVESEPCAIDRAAGRTLAVDLTASNDLPTFDNSAVDGFALQAAGSFAGQSLVVIADIRAGDSPMCVLQPGETARIMTGAMIPAGADAVIMVEDTDFTLRLAGAPAPQSITIKKAMESGDNIRHRGDDLHQGDKVLAAGTRLRAQEIGLLAMLGIGVVDVHRKPRLALLSSGDELLPLEAPLVPGMVRDTNSFTLKTLAQAAGAEVLSLGIASDTEADIRKRLDLAIASKVDLILSSAGVSVGAFDYVKAVIESQGTLEFWRVNMRPGKPLAFGAYHDIPFIGLPGNPVSAFVGFEVFVRPALERLNGLPGLPRLAFKVRVAEQFDSDGRESYLRVLVREEDGVLTAHLAGHQGSGNLFSLVQANALLIVPSGVKCVTAKSELNAWLL